MFCITNRSKTIFKDSFNFHYFQRLSRPIFCNFIHLLYNSNPSQHSNHNTHNFKTTQKQFFINRITIPSRTSFPIHPVAKLPPSLWLLNTFPKAIHMWVDPCSVALWANHFAFGSQSRVLFVVDGHCPPASF